MKRLKREDFLVSIAAGLSGFATIGVATNWGPIEITASKTEWVWLGAAFGCSLTATMLALRTIRKASREDKERK